MEHIGRDQPAEHLAEESTMVNETNPLIDPTKYHEDRREAVDLTDPRLAKVTRLRLISDPGYPVWDVSYVHGVLKDGTLARVFLPLHQIPKGKVSSTLVQMCRESRVYAKGLGILDAVSTLN